MTATAIDSTASESISGAAARTAQRSPGLSQFKKSPFRLLRLPVTATAKQAVWQCDKALARACAISDVRFEITESGPREGGRRSAVR